ncbi:unnamed protein product [Rhizopus microsporus]|uniref:GmrSD restriction endonucleases N-terminal domain-containing protein n=1 Tax=Rhizopus microsporus TaxID=58291 RepID=A0A1X0SA09_RHIZD|nr:hypothetical protein BCV71DRAFT_241902 [Rhizopus microsporus]
MRALIDSLLNNYHVPPLLFAIRQIKSKKVRVCIDGKQRLTSIYKFMTNEIPYVDYSSGEPVEYYFGPPPVENANLEAMRRTQHNTERRYLSREIIEQFNAHEIVCAEYTDLNEDDEYKIFLRIQLGVSLTAAEKLRANNTPIAKVCNALTAEYTQLEEVLPKRGSANVFQTIAQILCVLKSGRNGFKVPPYQLQVFIGSSEAVSQELIDATGQVLRKLISIIQKPNCVAVFLKHPTDGSKCIWKRIELLCFAIYLYKCNKTRSVEMLAEDCRQMRAYLHQRTQHMYAGKENLQIGLEWIETKLRENELEELDEFSDEHYELYESDNDAVQAPVSKRSKRVVPALARRGGKSSGKGRR